MSTNRICGFPIATDPAATQLEMVLSATRSAQSLWIVTLNLEMISRARSDPAYRSLLSEADVFLADGMPIVWASRTNGGPPIGGRTTGVDLVASVLRHPDRPRIGILGGDDPVRSLERLGVRAAEYVDAGRIDLEPAWLEATAEALRSAGVRLVLVALGSPRQDALALELRSRLGNVVVIGVGGSFELSSGLKPRAPLWMRGAGLEWAFRLGHEPRRLWRRYLLQYPVGAAWLVQDVLSARFRGERRPDDRSA